MRSRSVSGYYGGARLATIEANRRQTMTGGSGTRARAGSVSLFGQFFFFSPSLMGDVRVGSPGAGLRSASDA